MLLQAVAAAVDMSRAFGSAKVTVLVVDEPGAWMMPCSPPLLVLVLVLRTACMRGCTTHRYGAAAPFPAPDTVFCTPAPCSFLPPHAHARERAVRLSPRARRHGRRGMPLRLSSLLHLAVDAISDGSSGLAWLAGARRLSGLGPSCRFLRAGTDNTDPAKRLESINWHLAERGCLTYEVMERATKQPASVLLGEHSFICLHACCKGGLICGCGCGCGVGPCRHHALWMGGGGHHRHYSAG